MYIAKLFIPMNFDKIKEQNMNLIYRRKIAPFLLVFALGAVYAEEGETSALDALSLASARSVAARIAFSQNETAEEISLLVLTPRLSNITGKNATSIAQNVQNALIESLKAYKGVTPQTDASKDKIVYDAFKNTSVTNYLEETGLEDIIEDTPYVMLPVIYRTGTSYYITASVYSLESGRRLAYTKSEKCESAEALYATFGACEKAVGSLCASLKLRPVQGAASNLSIVATQSGERVEELESYIQYADGAYKEQNYKEAIKYYKKALKFNDVRALNKLGLMYYLGQGTSKNESTAFSYYKKSAIQGDTEAQAQVALMYENGFGVKQDYASAVIWYELASSKSALAQNNLGVMYESARGVVLDYERAVELYTLASEAGYAPAQNNLGVMYENGKGVKRDYAQAFTLYKKVAEQGNATAECNLGILYENGRGVSQSYATAAAWYQRAASKGNAIAQINLAHLYNSGLGVSRSASEAKTLLEKAKAGGDVSAKNNLDVLSGSSSSSLSEYTKSLSWYKTGTSCSVTQ